MSIYASTSSLEVCPAGWKKGDAVMAASLEGVAQYLIENTDKP
ncbi:MAG: hypothetical protein ACYC3N_08670 [Halothiobacillus sp.]